MVSDCPTVKEAKLIWLPIYSVTKVYGKSSPWHGNLQMQLHFSVFKVINAIYETKNNQANNQTNNLSSLSGSIEETLHLHLQGCSPWGARGAMASQT